MTTENQDIAEGQVETTTSDEERRAHHAAAMMLVRQYPDPVLRVPAGAVEEVNGDVRRPGRADDRRDAPVRTASASPRRSSACSVVSSSTASRPTGDVHVLINPELRERSDETETETEGCLSLLGGDLQVPVERHVRVVVAGVDADGEPVEVDAEGLEARVIQHEIDHLDGVLIVDRASKDDRKAALKDLRLRA